MRYFLSNATPPFQRVLIVESGGRHITERLLETLRFIYGDSPEIDLVTCYAGSPKGFSGKVYNVTEYPGRAGLQRLYRDLALNPYPVVGVICSGDPIMTKWKWAIALRLPAKIFLINENSDFFWLHRENWRTVRTFALTRMGMSGAGAVTTLSRLFLFPFTVLYLILFAAVMHLKRLINLKRAHI